MVDPVSLRPLIAPRKKPQAQTLPAARADQPDLKFDDWSNPLGIFLDVLDLPLSATTSTIQSVLGNESSPTSPDWWTRVRMGYGAGDLLASQGILRHDEDSGFFDPTRWAARIIGFAGDFALDPLSWVGAPGAAAMAKGFAKGAGTKAAHDLSDRLLRQVAKDTPELAGDIATRRARLASKQKRLLDAEDAFRLDDRKDAALQLSRDIARNELDEEFRAIEKLARETGSYDKVIGGITDMLRRGGGVSAVKSDVLHTVLLTADEEKILGAVGGVRFRPAFLPGKAGYSGGIPIIPHNVWRAITKPVRAPRGFIANVIQRNVRNEAITGKKGGVIFKFKRESDRVMNVLLQENWKKNPGSMVKMRAALDSAYQGRDAASAEIGIKLHGIVKLLKGMPEKERANLFYLVQTPANQLPELSDEGAAAVQGLRDFFESMHRLGNDMGVKRFTLGQNYVPYRLTAAAHDLAKRGVKQGTPEFRKELVEKLKESRGIAVEIDGVKINAVQREIDKGRIKWVKERNQFEVVKDADDVRWDQIAKEYEEHFRAQAHKFGRTEDKLFEADMPTILAGYTRELGNAIAEQQFLVHMKRAGLVMEYNKLKTGNLLEGLHDEAARRMAAVTDEFAKFRLKRAVKREPFTAPTHRDGGGGAGPTPDGGTPTGPKPGDAPSSSGADADVGEIHNTIGDIKDTTDQLVERIWRSMEDTEAAAGHQAKEIAADADYRDLLVYGVDQLSKLRERLAVLSKTSNGLFDEYSQDVFDRIQESVEMFSRLLDQHSARMTNVNLVAGGDLAATGQALARQSAKELSRVMVAIDELETVLVSGTYDAIRDYRKVLDARKALRSQENALHKRDTLLGAISRGQVSGAPGTTHAGRQVINFADLSHPDRVGPELNRVQKGVREVVVALDDAARTTVGHITDLLVVGRADAAQQLAEEFKRRLSSRPPVNPFRHNTDVLEGIAQPYRARLVASYTELEEAELRIAGMVETAARTYDHHPNQLAGLTSGEQAELDALIAKGEHPGMAQSRAVHQAEARIQAQQSMTLDDMLRDEMITVDDHELLQEAASNHQFVRVSFVYKSGEGNHIVTGFRISDYDEQWVVDVPPNARPVLDVSAVSADEGMYLDGNLIGFEAFPHLDDVPWVDAKHLPTMVDRENPVVIVGPRRIHTFTTGRYLYSEELAADYIVDALGTSRDAARVFENYSFATESTRRAATDGFTEGDDIAKYVAFQAERLAYHHLSKVEGANLPAHELTDELHGIVASSAARDMPETLQAQVHWLIRHTAETRVIPFLLKAQEEGKLSYQIGGLFDNLAKSHRTFANQATDYLHAKSYLDVIRPGAELQLKMKQLQNPLVEGAQPDLLPPTPRQLFKFVELIDRLYMDRMSGTPKVRRRDALKAATGVESHTRMLDARKAFKAGKGSEADMLAAEAHHDMVVELTINNGGVVPDRVEEMWTDTEYMRALDAFVASVENRKGGGVRRFAPSQLNRPTKSTRQAYQKDLASLRDAMFEAHQSNEEFVKRVNDQRWTWDQSDSRALDGLFEKSQAAWERVDDLHVKVLSTHTHHDSGFLPDDTWWDRIFFNAGVHRISPNHPQYALARNFQFRTSAQMLLRRRIAARTNLKYRAHQLSHQLSDLGTMNLNSQVYWMLSPEHQRRAQMVFPYRGYADPDPLRPPLPPIDEAVMDDVQLISELSAPLQKQKELQKEIAEGKRAGTDVNELEDKLAELDVELQHIHTQLARARSANPDLQLPPGTTMPVSRTDPDSFADKRYNAFLPAMETGGWNPYRYLSGSGPSSPDANFFDNTRQLRGALVQYRVKAVNANSSVGNEALTEAAQAARGKAARLLREHLALVQERYWGKSPLTETEMAKQVNEILDRHVTEALDPPSPSIALGDDHELARAAMDDLFLLSELSMAMEKTTRLGKAISRAESDGLGEQLDETSQMWSFIDGMKKEQAKVDAEIVDMKVEIVDHHSENPGLPPLPSKGKDEVDWVARLTELKAILPTDSSTDNAVEAIFREIDGHHYNSFSLPGLASDVGIREARYAESLESSMHVTGDKSDAEWLIPGLERERLGQALDRFEEAEEASGSLYWGDSFAPPASALRESVNANLDESERLFRENPVPTVEVDDVEVPVDGYWLADGTYVVRDPNVYDEQSVQQMILAWTRPASEQRQLWDEVHAQSVWMSSLHSTVEATAKMNQATNPQRISALNREVEELQDLNPAQAHVRRVELEHREAAEQFWVDTQSRIEAGALAIGADPTSPDYAIHRRMQAIGYNARLAEAELARITAEDAAASAARATTGTTRRSSEDLANFLRNLAEDDGDTQEFLTGADGSIGRPTTGFASALDGSDLQLAYGEEDQWAGQIQVWMDVFADELESGDYYLGMWKNPHQGTTELNLTRVIADRDEAVKFGQTNRQHSIFDLDAFETIETGGDGGRGFDPNQHRGGGGGRPPKDPDDTPLDGFDENEFDPVDVNRVNEEEIELERLLAEFDQAYYVKDVMAKDFMQWGPAGGAGGQIAGVAGTRELYQTFRHITEPGTMAKNIGKITSIWRGLALLSPGYHVRNFIGAYFNNSMIGASPKMHRDVGRAYWRYYRGKADLSNPVDQFVKEAMEGGYLGHGFFGTEIDDLVDHSKFNPLAGLTGSGKQWAPVHINRQVGLHTENWMRLTAGYKAVVDSPNLAGPARAAAAKHTIASLHFDYTNLSHFERYGMRNIMPFYTFASRNLGLFLQVATHRPQMFNGTQRIFEAMNVGVPANPFVPEFYNEQEYKQISQNWYSTLDLPYLSAVRDVGRFGRDADLSLRPFADLNPLMKASIDIGLGRDSTYGYEVAPWEVLTRGSGTLFPPFRNLQRIFPTVLFGSESQKSNHANSVRSFFAVPFRRLTEYDRTTAWHQHYYGRAPDDFRAAGKVAELHQRGLLTQLPRGGF